VVLSSVPKLLTGAAGFIAIAYLALCLFLLLRLQRLMFFPTRTIEATPADLNLDYEDVWIPVSSDRQVERLHGWWLPAKGTERGVVLHLHGNAYNVSANLGQAVQFHQLGFAVLMVDYRGYGRSEGKFPTEVRFYQDAEAAWCYLTQQRQIDPGCIWLFGHSLGGAIAIHLAAHHPEAAGLIVQSSFVSMRTMVSHLGCYSIFPIRLLLTQQFASITKVRSLQLPVLYIHGSADPLIPYTMSQALFAATPDPKQFHLVEGAAHNDVAEIGDAAYLEVLQQFMLMPLGQARNLDIKKSELVGSSDV
jgi:hypothetical protein